MEVKSSKGMNTTYTGPYRLGPVNFEPILYVLSVVLLVDCSAAATTADYKKAAESEQKLHNGDHRNLANHIRKVSLSGCYYFEIILALELFTWP